ncbi:hypothetical protein BC941DRAFT_355763 [Chlamydoabsidia padenii]|nr:hypothetical protein BC941DRAFT_355763 [Chlamydoabsidia padenii]
MINATSHSTLTDTTHKPSNITQSHKHKSTQQLVDTLDQCQAVGNVKGAVNLVSKAQENNMATVGMYQQLLKTILAAPLDIDASALVAAWFYNSGLPSNIKTDLVLWHDVLKLGLRLASTYRKEDLRALVSTFTTTFDLATLEDQDSWGLLIRAYGMLQKKDRITALMSTLATEPQYAGMDRSFIQGAAALAYASARSHEQVDKLVESLMKDGKLDDKLLKKLIRIYGFNGDLAHTQHYINLCHQMYPKSGANTTMQLIAHRAALSNEYVTLIKSRGIQGLPLSPSTSTTLDDLHASWASLISTNQDKLNNVTRCNVMVEYLTLANRIDPVNFPISKAQQIVDEYMPAHDIKPNEATWMALLNGYATTTEFADDTKPNLRLDKALVVLSRMDEAGFHANQECFHALFTACLPHTPGKGYLFEHFFLASRLTSALQYRPHFDSRIFDLEQIMMTSKIRHDRTTIKQMLTCLGVTGRYWAMWKRWRLLKLTGIRRDMGLYQHIFSLASMDHKQSEFALSVTRNEMVREMNNDLIPWNTYVAMLDCAITAQMPDMATLIINDMRRKISITSADMYVPILRAYTSIPALTPQIPNLLKEIKSNQFEYTDPLWQLVMSHHLIHNDGMMQSIHHLFNDYTMQRLEKQGKIPIPVRPSAPPFPSAPYSATDMSMINMYLAALLDTQDVSLVFDVLRVLESETELIGLSRNVLGGVVKLAKQEKSNAELSWLVHHVLPRMSPQNCKSKKWIQHLQSSVPK